MALLGRTQAKLQETADQVTQIGSSTPIVHVADVTKEDDLVEAAKAVGSWHIFVFCSGWCPTPSPIMEATVDAWWSGYEVCLPFFPLIHIPIF